MSKLNRQIRNTVSRNSELIREIEEKHKGEGTSEIEAELLQSIKALNEKSRSIFSIDEDRALNEEDYKAIRAYGESIMSNLGEGAEDREPEPEPVKGKKVDAKVASGLLDMAKNSLKEEFKHGKFRDGQEKSLSDLFRGDDVLSILPTGGGKSLLYQLPSLILPHITIVVSPLISLMKDQVDHFVRPGAAVALHSSLDNFETRNVLNMIKTQDPKLKLLFVSPERFTNERFLALIKGIPISMFAVDEAHCISEWGHAFRPDYLKLPSIINDLRRDSAPDMRVLLLTATCSSDVEADLRRKFHLDSVVRTRFHRPNLKLRIIYPGESLEVEKEIRERMPSAEDEGQRGFGDMDAGPNDFNMDGAPQSRAQKMAAILSKKGSIPCIIYTTRQKSTMALAQALGTGLGGNYDVRPYHAGLSSDMRQEVQDAFAGGKVDAVVATIAFGMGINKANVRTVIHYNMPRSLEGYVQEIGRAGRDGGDSQCVTLFSEKDVQILKNYVYGEEPVREDIRNFIAHVFGDKSVCELGNDGTLVIQLNLYQLSRDLDMPQSLLARLLAYLGELKWKLLREKTPMFMQYQWEPVVEVPESAEGIDRGAFAFISKNAVRKRKLTHLNVEIPNMAAEDRALTERVNRMLNEWVSVGYIQNLKVSQLRHRYEVDKSRRLPSDDELVESLVQFGQSFVNREVKRVDETGWLLSQNFEPDIVQAFLAERFGLGAQTEMGMDITEILRMNHTLSLSMGVPPDLEAVVTRLPSQILENGGARLAAKFLVGMSSPKILALRLSNHELFGYFDQVDFPILREELEVLLNPERGSSADESVNTEKGLDELIGDGGDPEEDLKPPSRRTTKRTR